MSRDYTVIGNLLTGEPSVHRMDCITVELARQAGWPILDMWDCAYSASEVVAEYISERNPDIPPVIHTCLHEENQMETTHAMLCPRCERNMFMPYGAPIPEGASIDGFAPPPALSRMDNETYICSPCGQDEAMRAFTGAPPVPPSEWPIRRDPEFGMGSGTPRPIPE